MSPVSVSDQFHAYPDQSIIHLLYSCVLNTELFALALPRLTGHGAVYSVNLLVRYPSLDPLITGVDPLPASSDHRTTAQCLDLLIGRRGIDDNFTKLLPV